MMMDANPQQQVTCVASTAIDHLSYSGDLKNFKGKLILNSLFSDVFYPQDNYVETYGKTYKTEFVSQMLEWSTLILVYDLIQC